MPTPPDVVAHLLRRAGFGATEAEVTQLAAADLPTIVNGLFDRSAEPPDPVPPVLADPAADGWEQWAVPVHTWLERMATTPVPLVEKMTLFWHGHFVSGNDKVNDMGAMWAQVATYRRLAIGNVRALATAAALDPAMLRYLDNDRNVAGAPNQNFARELFELFLLGVGRYTEHDVAECARAWTGHTVDPASRAHVFVPERHDHGSKTIFGVTRSFVGPDVIDLVLDHPVQGPACARFLVAKLWTFFAHPDPPAAVVDDLAAVLLASGWELVPTLRALFLRPEFYGPAARDGLVRSPVEWCVALLKATGLRAADTHPEWWLSAMGQAPFIPPNVAGWKGNGGWLSTTAAAARADHAGRVAWLAREAALLADVHALPVDAAVDVALARFGVDRPSASTRIALASWLSAQRAVAWSEWFQEQGLALLVAVCPEMQLA